MTTQQMIDEQEMVAEHQDGEHYAAVLMDCPICMDEWHRLTGGEE